MESLKSRMTDDFNVNVLVSNLRPTIRSLQLYKSIHSEVHEELYEPATVETERMFTNMLKVMKQSSNQPVPEIQTRQQMAGGPGEATPLPAPSSNTHHQASSN